MSIQWMLALAALAAGEVWWVCAADRGKQRWARIDWSMASSILWAWAMWDLEVPVNCKWAALRRRRRHW